MSEKIGRFTYEVEPFQEDFTGELSWGTLGNLLLRCANLHASKRGFGRVIVDGKVYVWVLSRFVIEMNRKPRTGETFHIETWVRSAYRLFTDRCFAILDANEQPIGYAYSIWALINKETRETIEMSRIMNETFAKCIDAERDCPISVSGRIRVSAEQPKRTIDTYYSDIDVNNHVNSIRYIEHVLDLFPKSFYEGKQLMHIEMAYSEETYCGEPLTFYFQELEQENYVVEIRKNVNQIECSRGIVVCRSRLTFKNR